MKRITLLFLASLLAFSSCRKDPIEQDTPIYSPIILEVNTSVAGQVVDADNNPISDAFVSFGTKNMLTDENGMFKINNVIVPENRAFVKVIKEGYFHGSRTFFAYADQRSNVKITLLEKTIQGTVNESGGTITTPKGVELVFPENAIVDVNDNPYTGTVQVAAQYLDPTSDNILSIMPGDLRGLTTNDEEKGLTTFGMVAVELIGNNGELLNIGNDKIVQLSMPIASAQLSSAPDEIPLWYFDENKGVWIEEGKAILQGDKYVGDVSHFSFWNCDIDWDLIYLDGNLQLDGMNLGNTLVCLSFESGGSTAQSCGYTNDEGIYSGQVPSNTSLKLKVYSSEVSICGDAIYTQQIGSFTSQATADSIDIDPSTIPGEYFNLYGNIFDCDTTTTTDIYLKIEIDNKSYYYFTTDGIINNIFLNCGTSSDVTLTSFGLNSNKQSEPVTFPFNQIIDFGLLLLCEPTEEYIFYQYFYQGSAAISNTNPIYFLTENISFYDTIINGLDYKYMSGNDSQQNFLAFGTLADGLGISQVLPINYYEAFGIDGPGAIDNLVDIDITFTQYSEVIGETSIGVISGYAGLVQGNNWIFKGSFKVKQD